jgi:hypothetical protein
MKHTIRFLGSVAVSAFMLTGLASYPTFAQDKAKDPKVVPAEKVEKGKAIMKVLFENDRVQVLERVYRPGDVNVETAQAFSRVNRTLKGGTLERTYPDGRKQKVEVKTGTVRFLEPSKNTGETYTSKNIGKTEIVAYVVVLKK